jgi:hypothetical protein
MSEEHSMAVSAPARDTSLPAHPMIRAAAYATPLCVLPSAVWRLHAAFWGNTALIFAVYAYAVLNPIFEWRRPPPHDPTCPPPDQTAGAWLAYAAYAPLLLWGPLLLAVTVAYYRRRTRSAGGSE